LGSLGGLNISGIERAVGDLAKIADNTEQIETNTASGGIGSALKDWGLDLVMKTGASLLGGIEAKLMSVVVDPIINVLSNFLRPVMDSLEKLVSAALKFFQPVIDILTFIFDILARVLGYQEQYNEGRSTAPGAYQYAYATGGIAATPQTALLAERGPEMVIPFNRIQYGTQPMNVTSSVQIEHMEINGVKDAEDAGSRAVEEISRYEEATTRQMARSFEQGMLKREAMER